MATNPDPSRITAAQWWFWEELHRLEPASKLGGFYAFKSGYHSTRADNRKNWPGNYSITDPQDRGGPDDKSGAFDWTFPDAQAGRYATISKYMARIIASGKDKNDERLNGWREFYGQADGDLEVEGWDCRYLVPVSSDSTHLWHIHGSENRELVESYANKRALLSVLAGEPVQTWRDREKVIAAGGLSTAAAGLVLGGDKMYVLAKNDSADPTVWLCDGIQRRPISSEREKADIIYLASQGAIPPLWKNGEVWVGLAPAFGTPIAGPAQVGLDQASAAAVAAELAKLVPGALIKALGGTA